MEDTQVGRDGGRQHRVREEREKVACEHISPGSVSITRCCYKRTWRSASLTSNELYPLTSLVCSGWESVDGAEGGASRQ